MTRAAIYARYSSDLQSEASIEDQIAVCRAEAERRGLSITEVFTDAAISGASARRPGLQALQDAARAGAFDIVLAEALDRISRDQEDVAGIFKRLTFAGIALVTLSEGEIGPLHIGLKGTMNALFLQDLAAKVRRGQRGRVKAGKVPGGLSYGYRVVRRLDDAGELVRGEREIDPDQAAVVVEIFERYAAGESARSIAHDLNRRRIPAPRSSAWRANTITGNAGRQNGILHNPIYRGRLVYNRVRMVKDPESGKRISRINDAAELESAEVPALRIVGDALWQAAQDRRRQIAAEPFGRRRRAKRLLSGLLRCGACGGPMAIVKSGAYGCVTHREKGLCSNGRTIRAAEAEARILEALKASLLTPENVALYVEEYQRERRRLQQEAARTRRRDEKRIADLAATIERLVDGICDGSDTPASRARLLKLEAEKAELEAATSGERGAGVERLVPNLAQQFRDAVGRLQEELATAAAGGHAEDLAAVRSMIEKVVVTPGPHRKAPCGLALHGSLAELILATGDSGRQDVRMMPMVAGEGLEPPTRGL